MNYLYRLGLEEEDDDRSIVGIARRDTAPMKRAPARTQAVQGGTIQGNGTPQQSDAPIYIAKVPTTSVYVPPPPPNPNASTPTGKALPPDMTPPALPPASAPPPPPFMALPPPQMIPYVDLPPMPPQYQQQYAPPQYTQPAYDQLANYNPPTDPFASDGIPASDQQIDYGNDVTGPDDPFADTVADPFNES